MSESPDTVKLPRTAVLVRTSGFCSACDTRFVDQLAYRFPAPELPAGFALIEARHVAAPGPPESRRFGTPERYSRPEHAQPSRSP